MTAATVTLVVSLGVGLAIGCLLPEEATHWEAVKLAASVGLCLAMMLLTYEHYFVEYRSLPSTTAARRNGNEPTVIIHAGVQTDDVPGLVPLHKIMAKGAGVSAGHMQGQARHGAQVQQTHRQRKKLADDEQDGARFFVD